MSETSKSFRLASLNVLWRPEELPARLTLLMTELDALQPDIVCIQEASNENMTALIAAFKANGYPHHAPVDFTPSYVPHWNMTFTKTPAVHELLDLRERETDLKVIPTVVTVTKIGDSPVHVLNTHLVWGARQAGYRTRQATKLAAYAHRKKLSTPIVLAGDLNTPPESEVIRYLTGLQGNHEGDGTLWLDAWAVAGADDVLAVTSDPHVNTWARETCLRRDLNPDQVPQRRIDYILTHEWKYGGRGAPSRFGRFADKPDKNGVYVSDHYGIWADINL